MVEDIAIQTQGLAKRYGSFWALSNCTIAVPKGSITALVGPNGAGKTTLLKIIASLNKPSKGEIVVLGSKPSQSHDYLAEIGYLAQEIPLYNLLTASQHITMGRKMNERWDNEHAYSHLRRLGIPLDRAVGKLSGGQRAQVGLALALAKKPKLLLLDEPVAALDPLARTDFLSSLAAASADAEGDLTVVMSSHLLSDLERICDQVIILAAGETQLCDSIDHAVESHKMLIGPDDAHFDSPNITVVQEVRSARQSRLLVHLAAQGAIPKGWHVENTNIEDIVLGYMGQHRSDNTGGKA
jgi:ABC-2 type transport system ATP-binding protein